MSHPELLTTHLDGEEAVATVNLSGEDALVITPTRSLRYESEGILSDESVTEYPHDVDGVAVSDGRRKATVELQYPIEGEKTLRVPNDRLDAVLHYVLAGIFHAKGITRSGETVRSVFQFNELTVVITSDRVLSHVGALVWDEEYDEYPFDDLTGVGFEEGNIATEIVLYVDGRSQRIKVPKGRGEEVKRALEEAILEYADVDSLEAFRETVGGDQPADTGASGGGIPFDDVVQPLGGDTADSATEDTDEPEVWPYELEPDTPPSLDVDELEETILALRERIEDQRRALDAQADLLADLADLLPDED